MDQKFEKNIDVSIIYVNYFSFELTSNSIETVIKHCNSQEIEIIVVDNASKDGSLEKLREKFVNVVFIANQSNLGFAAANNIGLKVAKGKYILFLNNDTLFIEDTINKVFQFTENRESSDLVGCKLLNSDHSLQYSVMDFPSTRNIIMSNLFLYFLFPKSKFFNKFHLMNKNFNRIGEVDSVVGAFIFAKRSDLLKLNGFDERFFFFSEDIDLCYRFKKNIGNVIYFPESSVIHLKGSTSYKSSWFKNKNRSVATIRFIQKHFSRSGKYVSLTFHYFGIIIRIPLFFILGLIKLNSQYFRKTWDYIRLLTIYPKNLFFDN